MNMQSLDFNLLKALHALLVTHSVSEAARRVGITQPAMSAALGRLRTQLGDPILIRRGNRMLPTPNALAMTAAVSDAAQLIERVLSPGEATFSPGATARHFSLATTDDVITTLGSALLQRLRDEIPNVRLSFKTLDATYNLNALELGEIDGVITVDWTAPEQLRRRRLYKDRFVCVSSKRHPCARQKLTTKRFAASEHLLVAPLGGSSGPVDASLEDIGLTRSVSLVVPNFTVVGRVLNERPELLCTMPAQLAHLLLSENRCAFHQPPFRLPIIRYDLFWHLRVQSDPVHRWFRKVMVEVSAYDRQSAT